jgi:hypothetical protein
MMSAINRTISAFLGGLCRVFAVSPDAIRNNRRGNLPPPEGGIAAF